MTSSLYTFTLLKITDSDKNTNIIINRNLELLKTIEFLKSDRRKQYGVFNSTKSLDILKHYTNSANAEFNRIRKLKILIKLYNYIFLFLCDIFKFMPRYMISAYHAADRLLADLDNLNRYLTKLEIILQNSILRVVYELNNICARHTNILIRLPYEIFKQINNYNIFNVFGKYDGTILDSQIAHDLNNRYKKYIVDIIVIFIKKIDIYSICNILNFITLKGIDFNKEITYDNLKMLKNNIINKTENTITILI
jgi:hypothetical protein